MQIHTVLSVAGIAAIASTAAAGPVTFDYVDLGAVDIVRLKVGNEGWNRVYAGNMLHDLDGQRVVTYCIDPWQEASTGSHQFESTGLMGAFAGAANAPGLVRAIAAAAEFGGIGLFTAPTMAQASAFQVALWEIIGDYDPEVGRASLDFGSGNIRIKTTGNDRLTSEATAIANQLLDAAALGDVSGTLQFTALTHPEHQDFFTATVIPAPGVFALAAIAGPFVLRRRRG